MHRVKLSEVWAGDILIADEGFTCVDPGPVEIKSSGGPQDPSHLYFLCREGRHYIQAQMTVDGTLTGLSKERNNI